MKYIVVLVVCFLGAQAVKEDDITYHFHNRTTSNYEIKHNQLNRIAGFDFTKPSFILIHGWHSASNSPFDGEIVKALLKEHDVNVIVADWSPIAKDIYIVVKFNVPTVGKYVGYVINNITEKYGPIEKNLSFVGHSLGAHVAGVAARYLGNKPDLIVGLDPAFPFVNIKDENYALCKADAKFVQVIHSGIIAGIHAPVGHADYFPNGGFIQPGCGINIECYHKRSHYYYAESLKNNKFCAHSCAGYWKFKFGHCNDSKTSLMGGYPVDESASGKYYLDTNSKSPYGRGPCGSFGDDISKKEESNQRDM
ncbi:unnamed protein product [Acanthoscelides obtectus]|uniref:Lipase domain-containing protein n=1 Tax=Acanthoscelides obtectus TaxID=200917 RepID=A0A9P0JLA2_ACAOB|nr:unnamed protein product [Acanthoscelides obtectus]CAK1628998.1 Endothelial lipase [Acanthoscelides obtectus]